MVLKVTSCLERNQALFSLLDVFKQHGVTLYANDIEELLHLKKDTLSIKDKVVPIIQLRQ